MRALADEVPGEVQHQERDVGRQYQSRSAARTAATAATRTGTAASRSATTKGSQPSSLQFADRSLRHAGSQRTPARHDPRAVASGAVIRSFGRRDTPTRRGDRRVRLRWDRRRAARDRPPRRRRCGRDWIDRGGRRARDVAACNTSVNGMPACASSSSSRISEMPWKVAGLPRVGSGKHRHAGLDRAAHLLQRSFERARHGGGHRAVAAASARAASSGRAAPA